MNEISALHQASRPSTAQIDTSGHKRANRRSPHENETRARFVYVITRPDRLCKIGVSKNVKRRLSALQMATPDRLTLFHHEKPTEAPALEIERGAMVLLKQWHASGEWFRCKPRAAVLAIQAARNGDLRIRRFLDLLWQSEDATAKWERLCTRSRSRDRDIREEATREQDAAWEIVKSLHRLFENEYLDLWRGIDPYFIGVAALVSGGAP